MTAVSLAFLIVCLFGAFAYGSATWMAVRQASPARRGTGDGDTIPVRIDSAGLAMFAVCTVWFAINAVAEFRLLASPDRPPGLLQLAVFALTFAFPPLIMRVVRHDACAHETAGVAAWRWPVLAMSVASPIAAILLIGGILDLLPRPQPFGGVIGATFSTLFIAASVYSMAVTRQRRALRHSPEQRRLGTTMLALFAVVSAISLVFSAIVWTNDRIPTVQVFERLMRATPLMFLSVAVYFENRFEFYDLLVKRGVMLLATVIALGLTLIAVQPILEALPESAVRPWLGAVVLVPAAMSLPWLSRALSSSLDRLWFGREFTPVEAVKHLLGAMPPSGDDRALAAEAGRRVSEIVQAPVEIRVRPGTDDEVPAIDVHARTPSGDLVRFVVPRAPGTRPLLSEDIAMLRTLASVFAFMLETTRLQHKRQEQELVAQDLRLEASRSALKALRAQINPHFLFNALNAIASLIHTDPARADAAVEQLAEVFRHTLRRSESEWAPLDQELVFARAYLDVEQARFGPRLTCVIDTDHPSPAPLVPSMLLQTLIENAVKHGVSQVRGPGRIEVRVRGRGEAITIDVRDNGPGPAAGTLNRRDGEGFGLRSVRERLAGHFGDGAALTLGRDEAAGMTVARLSMPFVTAAAAGPDALAAQERGPLASADAKQPSPEGRAS